MANCIGLKEMFKDAGLYEKTDPARNKRFNFVSISGALINNLFAGNVERDDSIDEIKTIIDSPDIFRKSEKLFKNIESKDINMFLSEDEKTIDDENIKGQLIKARSIAFHEITEQIKSSEDIKRNIIGSKDTETNRNKALEQIDNALLDENTGLLKIPSLGLYESIGRKYLESIGLHIDRSSASLRSAKQVAEFNREVGKSIVKSLGENGLVVIDSNMSSENQKIMNNPNNSIFLNKDKISSSDKNSSVINVYGVKEFHYIKLNDKTFGVDSKNKNDLKEMISGKNTEKQDKASSKFKVLKTAMNVAYSINNIMTPRNLNTPNTDAGVHNAGNDAIKLTKTGQLALDGLARSPIYIQPHIIDFLKKVKNVIGNDKELTYKDIAKRMSGVISGKNIKTDKAYSEEILKNMFMIDNDKLNDLVSDKTEISRQISKTAPLALIISEIDTILEDTNDGKKPLYTDHTIVKNGRLTNMLNVLNVQSDKKFSRAAVATTPVDITLYDEDGKETTEFKYILEDLKDNYNVTEEIMNGERVAELISLIDAANEEGSSVANELMINMSHSGNPFKSSSLFDALNAIEIIYKIKKSISEGKNEINDVTYVAGPDARASGATIMLLDNISSDASQETLYKLGIIKQEQEIDGKKVYETIYETIDRLNSEGKSKEAEDLKEEAYADVYNILVKVIEKMIKAPDNDGKTTTSTKTLTSTEIENKNTADIINRLRNKAFTKTRDILKAPIMTFIYGQSHKNNQKEFGKQLVDNIFNGMSESDIRNEYKNMEVKLNDGESIYSDEARLRLADAYSTSLGAVIVNKMEEHFDKKLFKEYHDEITRKMEKLTNYADDAGYTYSHSDAGVLTPLAMHDKRSLFEPKPEEGKKGIALEDYIKLRKHNAPLTKRFQNIDNNTSTQFSIDMINQTTAKVLPQHIKDSDVIKLAYAKYFRKLKKEYNQKIFQDRINSEGWKKASKSLRIAAIDKFFNDNYGANVKKFEQELNKKYKGFGSSNKKANKLINDELDTYIKNIKSSEDYKSKEEEIVKDVNKKVGESVNEELKKEHDEKIKSLEDNVVKAKEAYAENQDDNKKALDKAIKELNNYKYAWSEGIEPSAHIHDQIKGGIKFSMEFEKYYNESLLELTNSYDFLQALQLEIEYAESTKKSLSEKEKEEYAINYDSDVWKSINERIAKKRERLNRDTFPLENKAFGNLSLMNKENMKIDSLSTGALEIKEDIDNTEIVKTDNKTVGEIEIAKDTSINPFDEDFDDTKVNSVQQVLEQYKKDENIEKENAKLLKYIQDNVKFEMNYSKQLAYDFFTGESIAGLYDWKENVVTIADFEGLKADKEMMKMLSIEQVNQDDSVKDIDTASTQINMIISEINKRNIKFTTKLHESVHAAVFNYMRSDKGKAYSDEMNKLYNVVKESAKANPDMFTTNKSYWAKDVDEFLAEALSKPELIKDLMKIDVEGNLITGAEKSMFEKIIDMIVEALGLSTKEDKLNMHKYLLDSFKAAVKANRDGKEYPSFKAPDSNSLDDSINPNSDKFDKESFIKDNALFEVSKELNDILISEKLSNSQVVYLIDKLNKETGCAR